MMIIWLTKVQRKNDKILYEFKCESMARIYKQSDDDFGLIYGKLTRINIIYMQVDLMQGK